MDDGKKIDDPDGLMSEFEKEAEHYKKDNWGYTGKSQTLETQIGEFTIRTFPSGDRYLVKYSKKRPGLETLERLTEERLRKIEAQVAMKLARLEHENTKGKV